jgi:hypothetical protein
VKNRVPSNDIVSLFHGYRGNGIQQRLDMPPGIRFQRLPSLLLALKRDSCSEFGYSSNRSQWRSHYRFARRLHRWIDISRPWNIAAVRSGTFFHLEQHRVPQILCIGRTACTGVCGRRGTFRVDHLKEARVRSRRHRAREQKKAPRGIPLNPSWSGTER